MQKLTNTLVNIVFISTILIAMSFIFTEKIDAACKGCTTTTSCGSCSCSGIKYCTDRTCCEDMDPFEGCVSYCTTGAAYPKSCIPPCSCIKCPSICSTTCIGVKCGVDGCNRTCYGTKDCTCYLGEDGDACTSDSQCCSNNCERVSGQWVCVPSTYIPPPSTGCPSGQTVCYFQCVDLKTNESNCGSCGTDCLDGWTCIDGHCTANTCLYGDCDTNADCVAKDSSLYGDTCIPLKNPAYCYCTRIVDTSNDAIWDCDPYRDWQIVDGICYQQWECINLLTGEYIYQIRTDCEPIDGDDGGDGDDGDTPVPSCSVSLVPSAQVLRIGDWLGLSAQVSASNGTVESVNFSTTNSSVTSINPSSDTTSPYSTTATAQSLGESTVMASVYMNGLIKCISSSLITVSVPGPWWQVGDADISTNGNITSVIPSSALNPMFILNGPGGFPGIPTFLETLTVGPFGSISSTSWSAQTATNLRRAYSYSWFLRQIPSSTEITDISSSSVEGSFFESGGTLSNGAYWYKFDGESGLDLTVSSDSNLGSRKVILLVENGDLYLNGKINLTDGEGFFMAIVGENAEGAKGNIYFHAEVGGSADGIAEIEGLFVADNTIYTGEGTSQLHIRGSLASMTNINLERDLDDDSTTPAEYIEYAPDLVINIPPSLRVSKYNWQEVAP